MATYIIFIIDSRFVANGASCLCFVAAALAPETFRVAVVLLAGRECVFLFCLALWCDGKGEPRPRAEAVSSPRYGTPRANGKVLSVYC